MKVKHKLLSDYQYTSIDKKIFQIKTGTIIEDYRLKGENLLLDKEVIDANPQLFQLIDWKIELLSYLKANKIPQPSQVSKKMLPFIEDVLLSNMSDVTVDNTSDRSKELEDLESSLKRLKSRLDDRDEDIEIRDKFLSKREDDLKDKISLLKSQELELSSKLDKINKREGLLNTKESDINSKERDMNSKILESYSDVDEKLNEMRTTLDRESKELYDREVELNKRESELSDRELELKNRESEFSGKDDSLKDDLEKIVIYKDEVNRIMKEIQEWEALHWKFQRFQRPPSTME